MSDAHNETLCIKQEPLEQEFVDDGIIFDIVKHELISDTKEQEEANNGGKELPTCRDEASEQKPSICVPVVLAYKTEDLEEGSASLESHSNNCSSTERGPYSDNARAARKESSTCDDKIPEPRPFTCESDAILCRSLGIKTCSVVLERCSYNSSLTDGNNVQQRTPDRDKKFRCSECNYSFNSKRDLRRHIDAVHLLKKDNRCPECSYSCNSKGALKTHIDAVHLLKKDNRCSECNYRCNRKSSLRKHIDAVHLLKKDNRCPVCNYSCNSKNNLKTHIDAVHLLKKDIRCSECNYSCNRKSNLRKHIDAVHLLKKDNRCSECNYSCNRKSSLRKHIDAVHLLKKDNGCS